MKNYDDAEPEIEENIEMESRLSMNGSKKMGNDFEEYHDSTSINAETLEMSTVKK